MRKSARNKERTYLSKPSPGLAGGHGVGFRREKQGTAYLTTRNAGRLPEDSSWLFILPCFRAFLTRTPLIKK
jgi:hypothetical protein